MRRMTSKERDREQAMMMDRTSQKRNLHMTRMNERLLDDNKLQGTRFLVQAVVVVREELKAECRVVQEEEEEEGTLKAQLSEPLLRVEN
jgi:hypothetical protein